MTGLLSQLLVYGRRSLVRVFVLIEQIFFCLTSIFREQIERWHFHDYNYVIMRQVSLAANYSRSIPILKYSCRHINHINDTVTIDRYILFGDNLDALLGDKTS